MPLGVPDPQDLGKGVIARYRVTERRVRLYGWRVPDLGNLGPGFLGFRIWVLGFRICGLGFRGLGDLGFVTTCGRPASGKTYKNWIREPLPLVYYLMYICLMRFMAIILNPKLKFLSVKPTIPASV